MIKTQWFKTYEPTELPKQFSLTAQSWDTACKSAEVNDFSVCTTWGISDQGIYLTHVLRRRMDYPELRRTVKEHAQIYRAKNVIIEDRSSGTQLIQDLQADGLHETTRYTPKMDKIVRMHSVSSMIESGFVHIPAQADWLASYLHELAVFPNGRFDDQVDSTSQGLDWIKCGMSRLGLIELYKGWAYNQAARLTTVESASEFVSSSSKDSDLPKKNSCPQCSSTCVGICSGQSRCNSCGHQWWPNEAPPKARQFSRADLPKRHAFLESTLPWRRRLPHRRSSSKFGMF